MRAAIFTLLLLGGCSFWFVSGPPAHPTPPIDCTESRIVPAIDASITGAALVGAIAGLATHTNCDSTQSDCLASDIGTGLAQDAGAALLITALVFAVSTYHGFDATSACRRAVSSSPAARAPS